MSADYSSCGCTPYLLCVDHAKDWGKVREPDSQHWISRADYDELERRCDGLEVELKEAQERAGRCLDMLQSFREAAKIREELQCAENEQLSDLKKENDRLRAELNRRPRVGDRVRVTIDIVQREGVVLGVDGRRVAVRTDEEHALNTDVTNIEVVL